MYNILIIDDEEPLRDAIRILGDWKGLGIEHVLEAADGKSGLAMLEEHRIDLVIVDMKMPEIDGVQFLQIAERDYPDLLTIVISGYNDFEFTRQAIRSKVVDYLLKPINRQDLNQALHKTIDILDAKRQKEGEFITNNITLNMSLPKLKEKIYLSIIDRSFKKHANRALLPLIGADNPNHRYGVAVLRILNLERIRQSRFNDDTDLLHFAVANVIREIAGSDLQCFSFCHPKQEREMITISSMLGGRPEDLSFQSMLLMKKVAVNLKELFGIEVVIGLGDACLDALEIAGSYEAARSSVHTMDLLSLKGSVVTNKIVKVDIKEIHSMMSRMPFIRSALESGNLNQARSFVDEFMKKMKGLNMLTLEDADRTIHEFIFLLNDRALELGVPSEKLPLGGEGDLRTIDISDDFANFDQFEAVLNRILEYYSTQIRHSSATQHPFDAGDIKRYIDNHYFEDFTISTFTEKYFLSREYLMKLFKQQFGYGIHEYVQKVRMDKAGALLHDSNLKILEISEMLGYKDKNYFSKAFRNYYSLSPTEYRLKHPNGSS